jgi:AcrR family transcriptional regulator
MTYHHGNARATLLQAAQDLLEREGAARLSLRQISEQAGLSRQAPYNHFADKGALLAELVRDGFQRLGAQISGSSPHVPPLERLAVAAENYIAFGQDRPALFRLMFSRELVDIAEHRAAQEAASEAFAKLSAIIAAMAPATRVREVSLVTWSLVHGYTSLCIEAGLEGSIERHGRAQLFARTVEALTLSDPPAS